MTEGVINDKRMCLLWVVFTPEEEVVCVCESMLVFFSSSAIPSALVWRWCLRPCCTGSYRRRWSELWPDSGAAIRRGKKQKQRTGRALAHGCCQTRRQPRGVWIHIYIHLQRYISCICFIYSNKNLRSKLTWTKKENLFSLIQKLLLSLKNIYN